MGFSCGKIILTPTTTDSTNRDLGLTNIYNVNSVSDFCLEPFNSPLYYMSGATKPTTNIFSGCTSGITETCDEVHNLSETDSFNLTFVITGGTDYTGYTGEFCYKLFNRNNFTIQPTTNENGDLADQLITDETSSYENCVNFSGITSSTITETVYGGIDLPLVDNDYRVKSYVKYLNNTCEPNSGFLDGGSLDYVNTFEISDNYINFDYNNDWYFVSVVNPPTPIYPDNVQLLAENGSLFTERIIPVLGQTEYPLTNIPSGGVANVYVNGITLTNYSDYTLDYSQTPSGPVVLSFNTELELVDIITVTYVVSNEPIFNNNEIFSIETVFYTGSTSGVTATTENIINYNPSSGLHELFTQYDISNTSSVVLTLNGVEQTENLGYFKSTEVANKINLHPNVGNNLVNGDIISVWYYRDSNTLGSGDLGKLSSNDVTIRWVLSETILPQPGQNIDAYFNVEVTEEDDVLFTGSTYTATTLYSGATSYSELFEDVVVDKKYIYRVCLYKNYNTITEDVVTTYSCSENGSFDLTGGQVIYSTS